MADETYVNLLSHSVIEWNALRLKNPATIPNFSNAELSFANIRGANLSNANLSNAILTDADLSNADLSFANLSFANLRAADLSGANLRGVGLRKVDLRGVDLSFANLGFANLSSANLTLANLNHTILTDAQIGWTIFGDVDLRLVRGLETVLHKGPSTIGTNTIIQSRGDIPEVFLRGAGLTNTFIEYARSLAQHPFEYYTCFISYSSHDEAFANRLYADLQNNNVRCWFAPEDLKIGDEIRPRIDETIRIFDKLLLVLSQHSIASTWVAYEVKKALNKEPHGIANVLYPIRIDDTILTCTTSWAQDIKDTRHIGDFTNWKDHDAYQKSFERLLRALKQSRPGKENVCQICQEVSSPV